MLTRGRGFRATIPAFLSPGGRGRSGTPDIREIVFLNVRRNGTPCRMFFRSGRKRRTDECRNRPSGVPSKLIRSQAYSLGMPANRSSLPPPEQTFLRNCDTSSHLSRVVSFFSAKRKNFLVRNDRVGKPGSSPPWNYLIRGEARALPERMQFLCSTLS